MRPIPAIAGDHAEIVYVQTETLFAQWINAVASGATAVIMLAVYWSSDVRGAVGVWAAAIIVHVAIWLGLTFKWRRLSDQRTNASIWRNAYLSLMVVNGLLWGSGAVLTIPNGSADQSVFATIMVLGAVAMTFPYSIHYPSFLAFQVPTTLGGGLGFALSASSTGWVIGAMSLILCVGMGELGRQLGGRLLAASRLSIVNAELAARLTSQADDLREANEQLARLTLTDPLTSLGNRRAMMQALRAERGNPRCSFLSIDVDHFKSYNDSFGHAAGDDCLKAVSAILIGIAAKVEGVAVRQGGEEFGLVLHDATSRTVAQLGEKIRGTVERAHLDNSMLKRPITVSIGFATGLDGRSVDELMGLADAALYRAKHQGRNRVCGPDTGNEPARGLRA